jgi:hypothetical protein
LVCEILGADMYQPYLVLQTAVNCVLLTLSKCWYVRDSLWQSNASGTGNWKFVMQGSRISQACCVALKFCSNGMLSHKCWHFKGATILQNVKLCTQWHSITSRLSLRKCKLCFKLLPRFYSFKFSANEQRPHQFFSIHMKYKRKVFFLQHSIVVIYFCI